MRPQDNSGQNTSDRSGSARRSKPRWAADHPKGQPEVIGETLDKYLDYLGAPPIRTLSSLQDRWSDIVGPALAEPTRPIELVDGVLIIGCDDATWASQVGWMESQITTRFQALFPDTEIRRIKARIGR